MATTLAELEIFATEEVAYGVPNDAIPQQGDALRVTNIQLETVQPRQQTQEAGQGRSQQAGTPGRETTSLNISARNRLGPSQSSRPELAVLLKNLWGDETASSGPNTGYIYGLENDQDGSFAIHTWNEEVQRSGLGQAFTSGTLTWSGNDYTTWQFTGSGHKAEPFIPFQTPASGAGQTRVTPPASQNIANLVGVGNILKVATAANAFGSAFVVKAVAANGLAIASQTIFAGADNVTSGLPEPSLPR